MNIPTVYLLDFPCFDCISKFLRSTAKGRVQGGYVCAEQPTDCCIEVGRFVSLGGDLFRLGDIALRDYGEAISLSMCKTSHLRSLPPPVMASAAIVLMSSRLKRSWIANMPMLSSSSPKLAFVVL